MPRDDDALAADLERVDAALEAGDGHAARRALQRCIDIAGADHPDVAYAAAGIVCLEEPPEAMREALERVLELDPSHADAHYGLARLAEERGERDAMIGHMLRVLSLDARADRAARIGSRAQFDHVDAVAREVLAELPSTFAVRLKDVPIVLERRPTRDLVEDGFDPRALGLFEGPTDGDQDTMAPTRIVLYVHNLLAEFPDPAVLDEQIEITLLHEIGHYFNLEEHDMLRLGLE